MSFVERFIVTYFRGSTVRGYTDEGFAIDTVLTPTANLWGVKCLTKRLP